MTKQKIVRDETIDRETGEIFLPMDPDLTDQDELQRLKINEDQLKLPFVRNPYNYDADKISDETGLACNDISLTVQETRDEVDINTIVRNFGITGQLPNAVRAPTYGDFTGLNDYQQALNAVIAADEAFMQMPAETRARFHNNPAAFVEFCSKEENREEMAKMGLLKPEATSPKQPEMKEESAPLKPAGDMVSPSTITNK